MAFAGMFIIFFIVAAVILGGLLIGGLFLLIFNLVRMKKRKKNGETATAGQLIGIVIGLLMLAAPLTVGGLILFADISNKIQVNADRKSYINIIDKWNNPNEKFDNNGILIRS